MLTGRTNSPPLIASLRTPSGRKRAAFNYRDFNNSVIIDDSPSNPLSPARQIKRPRVNSPAVSSQTSSRARPSQPSQ
jgi:hypothetical protein